MIILPEIGIIASPLKTRRAASLPKQSQELAKMIDHYKGYALYGYIYRQNFHLTAIGKPSRDEGLTPSTCFEFTPASCRCSSCGKRLEYHQICTDCQTYL